MILLWGHASDSALKAVYESLYRMGAKIGFFDQRMVLETQIDLAVSSEVSGTMRIKDELIDLAEVSAAYIRPFDSRWLSKIAAAGVDSTEWQHAVRIEDALLSWAEVAPAFLINRPAAMASNTSKPYQAEQIRAQGFEIPATLVTTDPEAVQTFWEKHVEVIYKSVSSARSVVSRLSAEHLGRLNDISWCPTQFQEYIPGNDYRVHVVGDEIFGCEIRSEADDYRFAFAQQERVELRAFDLPEEVAQRCRSLTTALGLVVAGIDLRCTADGRWFCFEANAVAGFTYYQEACNHHIDDAIARLLMAG